MIKYIAAKRITVEDETKNSDNWVRLGYKNTKPPITKDNTLCYKLIAGLYIFYVSEEVYKQCIKEDLVEVTEKDIPTLAFEDIILSIGLVAFYRISYAIVHSTIDYLKSELQRVNSESKIIEIRVNRCNWFIDGKSIDSPALLLKEIVCFDLERKEIISIEGIDKDDILCPLRQVRDYETLLDAIVSDIGYIACNSRHLVDRLEKLGGFSEVRIAPPTNKYTIKYIR